MGSTQTGKMAERAAANYLEMRGYKILEMNWRRPHCEVDIIAEKSRIIYFVEVKYRKNDIHGSGLDYVTTTKMRRMQRGAESWVNESKYDGKYQLSAVEVTGPDYTIEHFIDSIE
jgi:putative endonuclease